jgi:AraC-like DNA-binding protein
MKTTHLKTTIISGMFEQLKRSFGGELKVSSQEHVLEIDNGVGTGRIRGISFKGGISYLEFDMTFSENLVLSINNADRNPIFFAYCSRGRMGHSFGMDGEKRTLESFQTGILTGTPGQENVLHFEKDERLKTTLITVQTSVGSNISGKKGLKHKLRRTFAKNGSFENFVYIGSHNLKIAEKVQELKAIKQEGIVRTLLIEGLVHMILALEIQQHSDDKERSNNYTGTLTVKEMDSVKEVSEFIKNYPETQLCLKQLSRKSGLSPSKLQEGFKLMHGTTVTDHIRDVRVRKSEDLIKNTDLNISEVVYSVGFTSRSYFSKIFKKKYNCSPKQYKNQQNKARATA